MLSAPFELSSVSSNFFLFDIDTGEVAAFPVVGRGTATIELIPHPAGDPFWEFSRVRYEFSDAQPIPEPATLLLFGTGMFALAAKHIGASKELRKEHAAPARVRVRFPDSDRSASWASV